MLHDEVVISETPWGSLWEVEAEFDAVHDEDNKTWSWIITSTLRADPDEQEPSLGSPRKIPCGWRPTAFLKQDGSQFRGTDSSLIVNRGWRQRGVPCRQIQVDVFKLPGCWAQFAVGMCW